MRMKSLLLALALVFCSGASTAAEDLLAIYESALREDPQLASAQAAAGGAEARYRQARARLLPALNGTASFSQLKSIDKSDDDISVFGGQGPAPGGGGAPAPEDDPPDFEDQKALALNLRQPLFNWSAFQAKDAAAARSEVARAELAAAEQALIVRSAQRYFDVLAAQEAVAAAQEQQTLIRRQLDRARASYESGLAPITDTLEAQSELDRTRVDGIEARNQLRRSRVALAQLIGRAPEQLAKVAQPLKVAPPQEPAERWVQLGFTTNPDVGAALLRVKAAEQDIGEARGGHYPTLDFVASIGEREQTFNIGFGLGTSTTVTETQSFGVELTVPLFAGFGVNAEVDAARYAAAQAHQDLIAAQRQVNLDVRTAYGDLQAAAARIEALEAAIRSGEAAAEAAKAGLQTGTRNILDVLQADVDLVQRKADLKQAWYDYLLAELRLNQAAGVLGPRDLLRTNKWLQARAQTSP